MTIRTVDDFVVPWVRTAESYSDSHLEFAWQHPEMLRMMSNENPLPPAESVIDAVVEMVRRGNLYPDTGPDLRRRLGAAAGLAPERLPDDAPPDPPEAVRQAKALDAPVLQYQHTVLTAEVMRALHENDVAVWSWNTEDEPSVVHSLECGADGLMGDDVRVMLEVLNLKGLR